MKIQTLSLVAGTRACNARCPYCISKQTVGAEDIPLVQEINQGKLLKAMQLAERLGVTTALITGKGEPTLAPDMVTEYIRACRASGLPMVELQTNGLFFEDNSKSYKRVSRWATQGLTLLAMSVMGTDQPSNGAIVGPGNYYPVDLAKAVQITHAAGLMFRLTLTMARDYVDTWEKLMKVIEWAAANNVDQVTAGPVTMARGSDETKGGKWAKDHMVHYNDMTYVVNKLQAGYRLLLGLPTGAGVYDVQGVAVCVRDCLSWSPDPDRIRQMIFFPEGRLMYDWESPAARFF